MERLFYSGPAVYKALGGCLGNSYQVRRHFRLHKNKAATNSELAMVAALAITSVDEGGPAPSAPGATFPLYFG